MLSSFLRANEVHLFIDSKIWTIDKRIVQSCQACRLSNQFCYIATKIFEKCVSCAISSRIIKKCEIIFIEYKNVHSFHNDFVDATFFSIFNFTNNFFVASALLNFFVNYIVTIAFRSLRNLIEDEIHFFISASCDNYRTNAKTIMSKDHTRTAWKKRLNRVNNELIQQEFFEDESKKKRLNEHSKLRVCIVTRWSVRERVLQDDQLNARWRINEKKTWLDKWENKNEECEN